MSEYLWQGQKVAHLERQVPTDFLVNDFAQDPRCRLLLVS